MDSLRPTDDANDFKKTVGKYVLDEKLGDGGFAVVYKAHVRKTGQDVAIKVVDKAKLEHYGMDSYIKREISLMTMLRHPNIVRGDTVINSKGKLYLVMELIRGRNLHAFIKEKGAFDVAVARRLFVDLMSCLQYCHEQGVYHRDLKLENLLIDADGRLKVCDFGLAKMPDSQADANNLCKTMVGTGFFVAPEILQQTPYRGDKADIWSAGVILYTILAGYCPFRGKDMDAVFSKIKKCRVHFPSSFPEDLRSLLERVLVLEPEKRPSASELLDFLHKEQALNQHLPGNMHEMGDQTMLETNVVNGSGNDSFGLQDIDDDCVRVAGSPDELSNSSAEEIACNIRKLIAQNPILTLAAQTIDGFNDMYVQMREYKKLLQDRQWRMRLYPKTFVGHEMVTWIAGYRNISRLEAVAIGDKMLQAEVFHHVHRDHPFRDEYLFYRFAEDDPDNSSVLNMRQIWPDALKPRDPLTVSRELLNSLLALVKMHQAIITSRGQHADVDIDSLRKDSAFTAFRMASAELQVVNLANIDSHEAKVALLVNVLHIMVLHSRIHAGRDGSRRPYSKCFGKYRYNISGIRISTNELLDIFQNGSALHLGLLSTSPVTPTSRSTPRFGGMFHVRTSNLLEAIKPQRHFRRPEKRITSLLLLDSRKTKFVPLILSNGSPSDPPIMPFSAADVTDDAIRRRVVIDIQRLTFVDLHKRKIVLPYLACTYRNVMELDSNKKLLEELISLLNYLHSYEVNATLWNHLKDLQNTDIPMVDISFCRYDDVTFAPRIELQAAL